MFKKGNLFSIDLLVCPILFICGLETEIDCITDDFIQIKIQCLINHKANCANCVTRPLHNIETNSTQIIQIHSVIYGFFI